MESATESTGKAARVLFCTLSFALYLTESSGFNCFYGNLDNRSSIQTCITADPPPQCFSVVKCEDPSQICYTYGNMTPTTNTFNYFSGCLLMDECQALKGSLDDCDIFGFGLAVLFNSEHFCSTCCADPYCNDLDVLQLLIPIPKITTPVITSTIPTTVTTQEHQTTTGAHVETSRLVATSTKPLTSTQEVEEEESTLIPTTDASSHLAVSTELTSGIPDTTNKGIATASEISSSVSYSDKPSTTTNAVDESTSLLMKDATTHQLVSTSILLTSDTTRTSVSYSEKPFKTTNAVDESTSLLMKDVTTDQLVSTRILLTSDTTRTPRITNKASTAEKNTEKITHFGVSTQGNHLQTSTNPVTDLVSTSRAESLEDSFTSWYEHTASTITTATRMPSTDTLSNVPVQTHNVTYPVESSQDYEKFCNSSTEAVFGVTRRGLHGLNVFFSRLDNTPPCIYGEKQHEQPSGNFPICANACLMSNSCQFLSFNRSKKICTIFSFPEV